MLNRNGSSQRSLLCRMGTVAATTKYRTAGNGALYFLMRFNGSGNDTHKMTFIRSHCAQHEIAVILEQPIGVNRFLSGFSILVPRMAAPKQRQSPIRYRLFIRTTPQKIK